jgi:ketosteroid isomerase-like protein
MNAAENKQLMQSIFSETAKGDRKLFVDSLADDVRWTIIGTTKWSKTYHGKEAVLNELLGPLRSQLAYPNRISAHRFIAEDDYVVVEARGAVTTKAGKPYHNEYCWICRIVDGKVQELIEYADTQLIATALGDPALS